MTILLIAVLVAMLMVSQIILAARQIRKGYAEDIAVIHNTIFMLVIWFILTLVMLQFSNLLISAACFCETAMYIINASHYSRYARDKN